MIDWVQNFSIVLALMAFVGGVVYQLWPDSLFGRFFRLGAALIPVLALLGVLEYIGSVGNTYRNVPYSYLWLWVVFWSVVSVVVILGCFFATVRAWLAGVIANWARDGGPLKFWGPENTPFWTWLVIALVSTTMFVAQSFSHHDLSLPEPVTTWLGKLMGWLLWLWEGTQATAVVLTPSVSKPLPPYPISWWWGWVVLIAWPMTVISAVGVFRDEVVDYLRKFAEWLRLRKGEAGVAGISDAAREARPAGTVAPIGPGSEQSTIWYWVKHILANAIPDLTFGKWFHPKA